ncbi:hypothetical protein [Limnohabitans sp.]|uniref:hypothetical protein n=1 Tax=Limnohabitans sp. TaxID=1907725 RepID=UPI0025C22204|nr:hypothetical protein [Limnohabitans sp.]
MSLGIKHPSDAGKRRFAHPSEFEKCPFQWHLRIKPLDTEKPGVGVHHRSGQPTRLPQLMHQLSLSVNDFDTTYGFFDGRTQKNQFHARPFFS